MILSVKRKLMSFAEIIHFKVFGHEMSKEMRKFVGHLSWSFFGGIIAAGIIFIVNIAVGRLLGPEEFGKYSIVVAIAEIIIVMLVFGLDIGIVRLVAKEESKKGRQKIISTSFLMFLISIALFIPLILLISKKIIYISQIDNQIFFVAVIFSIMLGFKKIFDGFIRGLSLFSIQAITRVAEAIVVMATFFSLYFLFGFDNYIAFVIALIIGGGILVIGYLWKVKKYISFSLVNRKKIMQIFHYSKFGLVGGISGIFLQSFDKLFIGKFIGLKEVGIYAAYYMVSIVIISQFIQLFINVFFPSISKIADKKIVVKKINTLLKTGSVGVFLLMIIMMRLMLLFFGKEYPIYWNWIIILGIYSVIHLYVSMYGWTLVSLSNVGFKKQNIGLILGIIIYGIILIGGYKLVGFSVELLLVALVLNRLTSGLYYYISLKKMLLYNY